MAAELAAAATDLWVASSTFLEAVGIDPKPGVEGLYQVRNYIIHQVRHMPEQADGLLLRVVLELSAFLSVVLGTFSMAKPKDAFDELNREYVMLSASPGTA